MPESTSTSSFSMLAAAAAISLLAFGQPEVDVVRLDPNARGEAVEEREDPASVRFTCRVIAKHDVHPSFGAASQRGRRKQGIEVEANDGRSGQHDDDARERQIGPKGR